MHQPIRIRPGDLKDLEQLKQLFRDTIINICVADYNEAQIRVWAAGAENTERWLSVLTGQYVLVAETNDTTVGFGTLDNGHYIDLLYVDKDYQGHGIARQLYVALETEARRQGQTTLTADVSKTARPFFEKMGFDLLMEQTVVRQGVALNNFRMKKNLL